MVAIISAVNYRKCRRFFRHPLDLHWDRKPVFIFFKVLPERLLVMGHGQKSSNREQVRASVHQDEEEYTGGVKRGKFGVVLHDVVEEDGHLLH